MKDKLEPNMYVRTKYGIAKITDIICGQDVKFDNDNIFEDDDLKRHHRYDGISKNDYFFKHDVIKASHNIIDLIEVGDYVNGQVVTEIIPENRKVEPSTMIYTGTNYYVGLYNEHIDTIVTKEQFSSIEYRLGEDK